AVVVGLAAGELHLPAGEGGGRIGPVGDGAGGQGPAADQVLTDRHGVGPGAQLLQKVGGAAVQSHHKGAVVRGGHRQQGGVPGLLDLIVAADNRQQLPVGQIVGRVRQPPPGGGKVLGGDRLPVGPLD